MNRPIIVGNDIHEHFNSNGVLENVIVDGLRTAKTSSFHRKTFINVTFRDFQGMLGGVKSGCFDFESCTFENVEILSKPNEGGCFDSSCSTFTGTFKVAGVFKIINLTHGRYDKNTQKLDFSGLSPGVSLACSFRPSNADPSIESNKHLLKISKFPKHMQTIRQNEILTAYKTVLAVDGHRERSAILELHVPKDARKAEGINQNPTEPRKYRASYAYVKRVLKEDGSPFSEEELAKYRLRSWRRNSFAYQLGKKIEPSQYEPFNPDPFEHCSGGIHFVRTIEEAVRFAELHSFPKFVS